MAKIKADKLWSVEAEAGVLGSMIIDGECIGDVLPVLDDKSFKPEHQTIYDALIKLYIEDVPIDAIALRTELKTRNQLDAIGGVEYIGKLMQSVPSSANAEYYAGVVKDRQRYREMISTIEKMRNLPDEPLTVDEQIEQVQALALGLQNGKPSAEYFAFADHADEVAADNGDEGTLIETGLRNIDSIIGGISPGELVVIAGRPSMGKSALALQVAVNMAKSGLSVVFFSLEMTYGALISRALKNAKVESLKSIDILIHERADTPEKQIAFIKKRKQLAGADVVFVDYLQLMSGGRKSENRVQEITTISRKLKLAAVSEGVPIVALSQLNRQVEQREKHRPRLSDLRESGAIEQDADLVMLLHRGDVYRRQDNPEAVPDGGAELIVAKNRRGKTGIANLVFLDERVCFGDKVSPNLEGMDDV